MMEEERIERLTADLIFSRKELIAVEQKLAIAIEALEFYANGNHYKSAGWYPDTNWRLDDAKNLMAVDGDIENGLKAKEALEKIK